MSISRNLFGLLAERILEAGAVRAVKYLSPTETVKATRRTYKRAHHGRGPVEILFTLGPPNYEERKFVRACERAGEPFPVRRIQLKFPKVAHGKPKVAHGKRQP